MEKIELIVNDERIIKSESVLGEKCWDYVCKGTYVFEKGNIYGVISESGGGGESISCLLSGEVPLENELILIDEKKVLNMKRSGWYVGKSVYSNGLLKKERSIIETFDESVRKYGRFKSVDEIIEEFHLSKDKLDYKFSNNGLWEKWRSSLALGYANNKSIFCFPWMNSLYFYDCMYNSGVFRFFKMIKDEGAIIILPTSKIENIDGLADKVIEIKNPRFSRKISDSDCFKNHF